MNWSTRTGDSSSKTSVLLIAHRGGEGLWPSNTLFAFNKSLELSADVLETDIHSTSDNVLVVRHDPTFDSTTDGSGAIRDYSLVDLKKLDAGFTWTNDGGRSFPYRGQGITIPTLEEVFQAFPNALVNIDIKPKEQRVVYQFCEMLQDLHKLDQVIVGSFHDDQLSLFRRLCPHVHTAAGAGETRRFFILSKMHLDRFYNSVAFAFQIPETIGRLRIVTSDFIRCAHARGLQVHIWTVNETVDMLRLIEWGVDGLITDYPDRLKAVLGR